MIGGGTGTSILIKGLRHYPLELSVIVSTADDGGSSGRLREALKVVPPGDIRKCLVELASKEGSLLDWFSYRFSEGELRGHVVGNIVLAGLEKATGNIEVAIERLGKLFGVQGLVVPVTLFPTTLSAELENGRIIVGEHKIDEPRHNGALKIKSLKLRPSSPVNPRALRLIRQADAIIFGPGDLHTSILPSLLVKGVVKAIRGSRARKFFVTNLMTKYGQTTNFHAPDFLAEFERYLGRHVLDAVIVNSRRPPKNTLKKYGQQKARFVEPDLPAFRKLGVKVLTTPLLSRQTYTKSPADTLQRSWLRHDYQKLAKLLVSLLH